MRNVAIGADGTWNKPNQQDRDRQAPSNVVKMVRSIDEESTEIRQLKYYNTGVGTKGLIDKFHGGVAGKGLFGNMRHAYHALAINEQRGPFEPSLWGSTCTSPQASDGSPPADPMTCQRTC